MSSIDLRTSNSCDRLGVTWMKPEPGERASDDAARVLVVDADPALFGLLEEWLSAHGCTVTQERDDEDAPGDFALIVVDVPFPRQGGCEVLKRVSRRNPGAPIVALSSSFFAGVEASGTVARALGVASVLPKPVTRAGLIAALERLLPRAQ